MALSGHLIFLMNNCPRNVKFRGYYGLGMAAAAAARQCLCFT